MNQKNRQFLVICRVGDKSLHRQWIADDNRNFDLYLSYFGDTAGKYKNDAEFYDETKGPKWPILYKIIMENQELVKRYDAVWFPDDDIAMPTQSIKRMFNLFSALGLNLGQPALSLDSYVAHKELIVKQNSLARHINFIEVMAPIFSQDCLEQLQHTFGQSASGWGLDFLWPILLNHQGMALLDATPMIHTRPLGGDLYKNNEMSPRKDIENLAKLYPHLNISNTHKIHKIHKFQFFSNIRINYHPKSLARLVAQITRKKNKITYNKSARFFEK